MRRWPPRACRSRSRSSSRRAARGLEIVGDIELFARAVDAPVVGHHRHQRQEHRDDARRPHGRARRHAACASAATSASRRSICCGRARDPARTELYVLELSSFQLETTTSLDLQAATVLNVTPDHLDRYSLGRRVCRREGANLCPLRYRGDQSRRSAGGGDAAAGADARWASRCAPSIGADYARGDARWRLVADARAASHCCRCRR